MRVYETSVFPMQARFEVIRFNNLLYKIRCNKDDASNQPSLASSMPSEVRAIMDEMAMLGNALGGRVPQIASQIYDLEQEIERNRHLLAPSALVLERLSQQANVPE